MVSTSGDLFGQKRNPEAPYSIREDCCLLHYGRKLVPRFLSKLNTYGVSSKSIRHISNVQWLSYPHPLGKVTQELENQYEHRLAVELDRFDRLSEELEAVQQRCEGLLEAQQKEYQWELTMREKVWLPLPP